MMHIYWHSAIPDDFINAKLGDWVQGAGDITTNFELDFIHSFGKFFKEHCEECADENFDGG